MKRGMAGSGSSLGTTASGAVFTVDMVTEGEASKPLVTTGTLPVLARGGRGVVTSRKGDVVGSWTVKVLRTGMVNLRVAATVLGVAVVIMVLVVMVVVARAAVTMLTGL